MLRQFFALGLLLALTLAGLSQGGDKAAPKLPAPPTNAALEKMKKLAGTWLLALPIDYRRRNTHEIHVALLRR